MVQHSLKLVKVLMTIPLTPVIYLQSYEIWGLRRLGLLGSVVGAYFLFRHSSVSDTIHGKQLRTKWCTLSHPNFYKN